MKRKQKAHREDFRREGVRLAESRVPSRRSRGSWASIWRRSWAGGGGTARRRAPEERAGGTVHTVEKENRRFRGDNARLLEERDILKKRRWTQWISATLWLTTYSKASPSARAARSRCSASGSESCWIHDTLFRPLTPGVGRATGHWRMATTAAAASADSRWENARMRTCVGILLSVRAKCVTAAADAGKGTERTVRQKSTDLLFCTMTPGRDPIPVGAQSRLTLSGFGL